MESNLIAAYVEALGTVSREELMDVFGDSYDVPDRETLSGRYIAGKIAQDLSRARDKKKRRVILAVKDKDGTKYVFIPDCSDAGVLETIKTHIAHDIEGHTASLKKVKIRLRDLEKRYALEG